MSIPESHESAIERDEIFVAVMGATGVGKSTFIQKLAKDPRIKAGHGLESETQSVAEYHCQHKGRSYVLIDTPGFGDAYRSHAEMLDDILEHLASSYQTGTRLSGVIYLHPITDVRMPGSALEHIEIFRMLCGQDALRKVILVTTFWDVVDKAQGERREAQLKEKPGFWGELIKMGCKVRRLSYDNPASALGILDEIEATSSCVLQAQREIVDKRQENNRAEGASYILAAFQTEMEAKIKKVEEDAERHIEEQRRKGEEEKRKIQEEFDEKLRRVAEDRKRMETEEKRSQQEVRKAVEELSRKIERQRLEKEAQLKQIEEEKRSEKSRKRREARRARKRYYELYSCLNRRISWRRCCDNCGDAIYNYPLYYHCCHCADDDYNHCYECGKRCGISRHPRMELRKVPSRLQQSGVCSAM